MNNILDNKTFWKYIKPVLSDKCISKQTITLVEGNKIIDKDDEVAETFCDFFKHAVGNLEIQENKDICK